MAIKVYAVLVAQVQLFDLSLGTPKASLKGHGQPVTSLSFNPFASHMLVSGSADKRVRVFDSRCHTSLPSLVLRGHTAGVRSVQMDNWKVVSGRYVYNNVLTFCI